MKPTILYYAALVIFVCFGVSVFAQEVNIHACTMDKHVAVLTLDINDSAESEILAGIAKAFVDTAAELSTDELVSGDGFRMFAEKLTPEEYDAINGIEGPPLIGDSCR